MSQMNQNPMNQNPMNQNPMNQNPMSQGQAVSPNPQMPQGGYRPAGPQNYYPYQQQPVYFPQPAPKKRGAGMFFAGLGAGILVTLIVTLIVILVKPSTNAQAYEGSGGLTDEQATELVNKVGELVRDIQLRYYEDVDTETLLDGAYHGVVNAMGDKYAAYFNPEEFQAFMEDNSGTFVGIGVSVTLDEEYGGAHVEEVYETGGAYEAGLQYGDVIIRADGVDLTEMTLDELVRYIRGDEGTSVTIDYMRDGTQHSATIVRKRLQTQTVRYRMMEGNVGYIYLSGFEGSTTEQFHNALESLKQQGMTSLILDLRNNPGGRVDVVTAIADELLPAGVVTYFENKYGDRETYYSYTDDDDLTIPIIVMVNESSASASELLSGAIQARDAGLVVGTQSFGKGIAQTTAPYPDGSALKVTTDYYFLPNGKCIHGEGITPDYIVELPEGEAFGSIRGADFMPDLSKDTQLQKAMELLGVPVSVPAQ